MVSTGRVLLLTCLAALFPGTAAAWGDHGHRVICALALREMAPATRVAVEALLQASGPQEPFGGAVSFADACTAADHPRQRSPGHYVNVPRTTRRVTSGNCPAGRDCLFAALRDDTARLADASRAAHERRHALMLLGHWVGDLHQPLHVAFADDRGGNRIVVPHDGVPRSLHFYWDIPVAETGLPGEVKAAAKQLQHTLTDEQRSTWRRGNYVTWADESYQIVTAAEVQYCQWRDDACWYRADARHWSPATPARSIEAGPEYLARHSVTAHRRLQQAAVRLALLLEQALGQPSRP